MKKIIINICEFWTLNFPKCQIIICLLAITLLACSSTKQKGFEHLEKYFKEVHKFKLDNSINKIVVITEGTGCPSCDRAFANTTLENLQNNNTIFLVIAKGSLIDIQPFLNLEKNCFFDWQLNYKEYPEFTKSKVIYIKNNEIDTIITIKSELLFEHLEYIRNKK